MASTQAQKLGSQVKSSSYRRERFTGLCGGQNSEERKKGHRQERRDGQGKCAADPIAAHQQHHERAFADLKYTKSVVTIDEIMGQEVIQ